MKELTRSLLGRNSCNVWEVVRVAQRALECVTVNLAVEWEHDSPPVGMLHLHVATSPVNLDKPQSFQCRQHLSARQEREFHSDNSTTSRFSSAIRSPGAGSK